METLNNHKGKIIGAGVAGIVLFYQRLHELWAISYTVCVYDPYDKVDSSDKVAAAPLALGAVGFTAGGVAAGSAAAAIQSAIYGGATTGAFATAQSAGAAGFSWATTGAMATVGGYFGGKFDKKN